jgi:hypothetical protein
MAIGTNDAVRKFSATTITLESSGGTAIANNALSVAAGTQYDLTSTDHADTDRAIFTLTCSCATAFTALGAIQIVVRPMDIDGTTDAPVPTTAYPHRVVGHFNMINQTASQTVEATAVNLPRKGEVYLFNTAGQQVSTGWALKMTPIAYGPAP